MGHRWVKKFKSKEAVLKLRARSEKITTRQHLSVRVLGNVDAVYTSVGHSPRKSIQRHSQKCMVAILSIFLNKHK